MAEERDTEAAFKWIIGLLQSKDIPFQIAGGFAAKIYGSTRELADIDIGIPDNKFGELYPEVKEYITFGPARYLDSEWDLLLMTLNYKGQDIDISGEDDIKIFDKENNIWMSASRNLSLSEYREIYGKMVPLILKEALIAYKKKLMRDVDVLDIKELEV